MAIEGRVIPPNVFDILIESGVGTDDFVGFLNNLAKTATISGSGSPEGSVEAAKRTMYMDEDNAAAGSTFLYIMTKESGKTGWKLIK